MADTIDHPRQVLDAARTARQQLQTERDEQTAERQANEDRIALGNAITWAAIEAEFVTGAQAAVDAEFGTGAVELTPVTGSYVATEKGVWDPVSHNVKVANRLRAEFHVTGPLRDLFDADATVRCHVVCRCYIDDPQTLSYTPELVMTFPTWKTRRLRFGRIRRRIAGRETRVIRTLAHLADVIEEFGVDV